MEPLFIDTGGIEVLLDPGEPTLLKFWQRFPNGTRHFTSHIVYWEYLRQFNPTENSVLRQRFVKLTKKNGILFSTFGVKERDIAVKIYHRVKRQLEITNKKTAKKQLQVMHNDILIASEALVLNRVVLTQDVGDWQKIADAISKLKLGRLRLMDKRDIQNW